MIVNLADRFVALIGNNDQTKFVGRMAMVLIPAALAVISLISNNLHAQPLDVTAMSAPPSVVRTNLEDSIVLEVTRVAADRADAAHYGFWFARCGDRPKGYSEAVCAERATRDAPDFLEIEMRLIRDSVTIYSGKAPLSGDSVVRWVNIQDTPSILSARLVLVCTTDGRIGWRDVYPAHRSVDSRGLCWKFYEGAIAVTEEPAIPMPKNP